jgi:hypothetical protein
MIRKTRSASFLDAPPPRQAAERELGDTRTSGNGRAHRDRKAPKITVNSAPGKPLNIDMQPIDAVRLMSAFGTTEPGFATLMLSGIINAACGGGPSHPPGSGEINDALAAVTGIGARDETEGMPRDHRRPRHVAVLAASRNFVLRQCGEHLLQSRDQPVRGIGVAFDQLDGRHQHGRRAVAALEAVLLPEGLLNRVKPIDCAQTLDGADRWSRGVARVRAESGATAERSIRFQPIFIARWSSFPIPSP